MFFTIPTLMTWTRIVAIPLIVGVFYLPLDEPLKNLIATVMFVVFAMTDWLDGYLARRLNQTSAFGAFLDPVADKFLVCACLLVLVHLGRTDVGPRAGRILVADERDGRTVADDRDLAELAQIRGKRLDRGARRDVLRRIDRNRHVALGRRDQVHRDAVLAEHVEGVGPRRRDRRCGCWPATPPPGGAPPRQPCADGP